MEFIAEWAEPGEPVVLGLIFGGVEHKESDKDEPKQKRILALGLVFFQIGVVW